MFPQKYTLICPKIIFHTGTSRRPPQLARVSPAYYKNPLRGFCNTAAHSLGLAPQTRPASQKRTYHEITWISDSCLRHSQRPCGPNRTLKRKRYDEMARPKTDEPMDHIVAVRFTETEYQLFAEEAERQKISVSEYIRRQTLYGKIEVYYDIATSSEEIKKIREELHRIGINLNQISRFFNSGGKAVDAIIKDVQKAISDIYALGKEMKKLVSPWQSIEV